MKKYPIKKKCCICDNFFNVNNRFQLARNKTCSKECLAKIIAESNKKRTGWNHSLEVKKKLSLMRTGSNNPNWKGNSVSYSAIHDYIKRHLPKTKKCQNCNYNKPYDLANISQEYKRDLDDWKWLCRKCHMVEDGRIKNLKQYSGDLNERNQKEHEQGTSLGKQADERAVQLLKITNRQHR